MFKAMLGNQKGGVAKTTSAVNLARCFAEKGYRVLLVDTDPQGNVAGLLDIKAPGKNLFSFLVKGWNIQECIVNGAPNLDLLLSDRETYKADAILNTDSSALFSFPSLFPQLEQTTYDVVLMDTAPSIHPLQNCAAIYCRQLILPINMDILAVQGAAASLSGFRELRLDPRVGPIQPIAALPTFVDRRLSITTSMLDTIRDLSDRHSMIELPAIRTDAVVGRANKANQFLCDYDPTSKALQDYRAVCDELVDRFGDQFRAKTLQQTA